MRDSIAHFIWGYQAHFRHTIESEALRVLDSLKPGLNAKAFLVGVRIGEKGDGYPACVEPEIHHWAQSSDFYDVLGDVKAVQESYPESRLIHSQPVAQLHQDQGLFRRALRDAVIRRLEESPAKPDDIRIFASFPVEREDFLLMTIFTVTCSVMDEVARINPDIIKIHEYRSMRVPCSLVEAVIDQMLGKCSEAITQTDAGASLWVIGSADQVIRDAGSHFFAGLLNRVDQDCMIAGRAAEVFDILSRLSLTPYERAEAKGHVIFGTGASAADVCVLKLSTPVPLRQSRALRKLLALTDEEVILRCNCECALSLVRRAELGRENVPTEIEVRFDGRGKWAASCRDVDLMIMADGLPSLPQPVVDQSNLARDLRRLIPSMSEVSAALFAEIGGLLATSGHGSVVVIAEAARYEAVRLSRESLPVSPLPLTAYLAARLSRIDGALLCDPSGACHSVGVILDGRATASGDRGRGSRFNSAVRYVESGGNPVAAMVVSDDGGLDLLPRLRPPLSKKELSARLDELKRLALSPATPPDRDREVDITDWVERHAFYLSESQCEDVNGWIAVCRERAARGSMIQVSPRMHKRDPAFDPDRDLI